ncbi:MAG: hypothetical protein L6265_09370 [Thermoplasmatales archaeon]|nr:hypothetical protein [Thermoplasmatales archaeon]
MRKTIGLVIGVCLCFLFFSGNVTAVDYDHTYSDPSGDVQELGDVAVGGHDYIDITEVKSYQSGDNIILKMIVAGTITDAKYIEYWFTIYLTEDGKTLCYVSYHNGKCTGMGGELNASGSGTNTLTITIPITALGEHTTFGINHCTTRDGRAEETDYYDTMYVHNFDTMEETTDEDTTEGGTGDKEFIPGFEIAVVIGAIGISAVLISKKLR